MKVSKEVWSGGKMRQSLFTEAMFLTSTTHSRQDSNLLQQCEWPLH